LAGAGVAALATSLLLTSPAQDLHDHSIYNIVHADALRVSPEQVRLLSVRFEKQRFCDLEAAGIDPYVEVLDRSGHAMGVRDLRADDGTDVRSRNRVSAGEYYTIEHRNFRLAPPDVEGAVNAQIIAPCVREDGAYVRAVIGPFAVPSGAGQAVTTVSKGVQQ
ncbi:MAG: hypothetical protein AAGF46_01155, partial [Pseudomonadota bacterium]